jgi:hypothetical protein
VRSPPRRRRPWLAASVIVAALVTGALLGGLLTLVVLDLARKPPPLTTQLRRIQRAAASCGSVDTYPPTKPDDNSVIYLVEHRTEGCPRESDRLEVYDVHDTRLRRRGAFQPRPSRHGTFQLVCRGNASSNPCVVAATTGDPAFLGAWRDSGSGRMLLFVLEPFKRGYVIAPLEPHRRRQRFGSEKVKGSVARYNAPMVVGLGRRPSLRGMAVEDFALLQSTPGHPQVVRGYVTRGPFDAPRRLQLQPGVLDLSTAAPRLTPCSYSDDTHSGEAFSTPVPGRGGATTSLLRRAWVTAVSRNRAIC